MWQRGQIMAVSGQEILILIAQKRFSVQAGYAEQHQARFPVKRKVLRRKVHIDKGDIIKGTFPPESSFLTASCTGDFSAIRSDPGRK